MLLMAGGTGLVAASFVLLQMVRFREGQVSSRPEWLDISLAILVTSGRVKTPDRRGPTWSSDRLSGDAG